MSQTPWIILSLVLFIIVALEMYHSLKRSETTNRLINQYIDDLENEQLFEDIYAYCQKDFKLRRIMEKHKATKEDIKALHKKLLTWGNIKKGRRFVPITAFFYTYSLNYLFEHRDDDDKKVTMRMLNFFHI